VPFSACGGDDSRAARLGRLAAPRCALRDAHAAGRPRLCREFGEPSRFPDPRRGRRDTVRYEPVVRVRRAHDAGAVLLGAPPLQDAPRRRAATVLTHCGNRCWTRRGRCARNSLTRLRSRSFPMRLRVHKMHGLGNDFVVIDAGRHPSNSRRAGPLPADRHFGVGCDQLLVVERPSRSGRRFPLLDLQRRRREVEQGGKRRPLLRAFVHERGLTAKREIHVVTRSGIIAPRLEDNGDGPRSTGGCRCSNPTRAFRVGLDAVVQPLEVGGAALAITAGRWAIRTRCGRRRCSTLRRSTQGRCSSATRAFRQRVNEGHADRRTRIACGCGSSSGRRRDARVRDGRCAASSPESFADC